MKKLFLIPIFVILVWSCDSNSPSSILNSDDETPESLEKGRRHGRHDDNSVTVMTWNIYVGTDVDKVLGATSPDQIPLLAAEAFQMLLATNFQERADAIADQIREFKPHLVGLQEVSLLRIQSPGDAVVGGTTPAENVLFDYLQILMNALESRGLRYHVAGVIENTDAEVPMVTSPTPTFDDIRLTDYDVVLARHDVRTSDVQEVNYATTLPTPFVEVIRGYISLNAKVDGKRFRFVNTHLEPSAGGLTEPIQLAQANELISALSDERQAVIVVGDLNSIAPDGNTYQLMVNGGYQDTWPLNRLQDNPDGFTSSHGLDLMSTDPLFQRIDLIMVGPRHDKKLKVKAEVVGDEEGDKTVNGLWPSDHAGVVAEIRLK